MKLPKFEDGLKKTPACTEVVLSWHRCNKQWSRAILPILKKVVDEADSECKCDMCKLGRDLKAIVKQLKGQA